MEASSERYLKHYIEGINDEDFIDQWKSKNRGEYRNPA